MKVEAFLAWKYLTRKQRVGFISLITWISIAGMAVGVMTLIVVLAVMSGFDAELKNKIVGMQNHVVIREVGGTDKHEEIIASVNALKRPEIHSAAPFVEGQGLIRSNTNATGTVVRGLDDTREPMDEIKRYLLLGDIALSSDYPMGEERFPRVLIGQGLAWMLAVSVGDQVEIISPYVEKRGILPGRASTMTFVVSGIYAFGMNDFDTSLALIDVKSAQALFHLDTKVSGVGLRLFDVNRSTELADELVSALGPGKMVTTWIDQNKNFFSALKVEKTVMTIILSLIIVVAAFNIISSLIMLVIDKTKDIGVLRALGLSAGGVRRIFLLEGFFIGLFGTFFGAVSGFFIARNLNPIADFLERTTGIEVFPKDIYYFSEIPSRLEYADIAVIAGAAFILALLAAWYPAQHASRLTPVEALRYE